MPNIFYINPHNGIRGGNKVVFEHCNHLARRFQKCFIVCDDYPPSWMKVDAYFIDKKTAMKLCGPEDTVIFHWDQDVNLAMALPAKNKYYLIQHFIHIDESIFLLPINFISVSGYIQKHTKLHYNIGSTLIMNGIDKSVFYPRTVDREIGRIFVINLKGWKGAQDVEKAEKTVKSKIGSSKFIYKTNLTEEEIAMEYSLADIFVFPSWYEGFGLPALEAMACGVAVITTDSKGVDDFAFNNRNCLKIPAKNPGAIADAIIRLLENTAEKESLRAEGLKTSQLFEWDASINKLAGLFGLQGKLADNRLFKLFSSVKIITTSNNKVFGEQVFTKGTILQKLKKYKGGTRLINFMKLFGLRDTIKTGDFDYTKVSFVDKEGGESRINNPFGKEILYVPWPFFTGVTDGNE